MRDDPANSNVPYDWELKGHPSTLIRDWHPLPVLDPDIETQLRRSTLHIVRDAAPRLDSQRALTFRAISSECRRSLT